MLWFRPEMLRTVSWGGDPTKQVTTNDDRRPGALIAAQVVRGVAGDRAAAARRAERRAKRVSKVVNDVLEETKLGAGHGIRTRDIQLGKLALYQLS